MIRMLKTSGTALLDTILPPRCILCHDKVTLQGTLCAACFKSIDFIAPPACACCGSPFPYEAGEGDAICGACMAKRPYYDKAVSVMLYTEKSAKLITDFKYADRPHAASAFARLMADRAAHVLEQADFLVPVPLHWRRLWNRRYNQSAILAYGMRRFRPIPVVPDMLLRQKHTAPQASLKRALRLKNLRGAFAVKPSYRDPKHRYSLKGKTIALIDDVMTTGTTVNQCARILKRSGAAKVYVITLAMTPNQ